MEKNKVNWNKLFLIKKKDTMKKTDLLFYLFVLPSYHYLRRMKKERKKKDLKKKICLQVEVSRFLFLMDKLSWEPIPYLDINWQIGSMRDLPLIFYIMGHGITMSLMIRSGKLF